MAMYDLQSSPIVQAIDSPLLTCELSPVYGRFLKTKVDIKKGDLLLKEKYLVVGPLSLSHVVCVGCHSDLRKKYFRFKCTKCGWPLCANKCQKSPFHATECQFLADNNILPPEEPDSVEYGAITVLRALLLKKNKPKEWQKLMSLEAHNDIRKGSPYWDANEEHVVKVIREKWQLDKLCTAEEVHTICGIFEVNGFEIGDVYSFLGVFAVTSLIAHECVPNATHFENIDEGVMEVRAIVDIPAGTAVTICYDCALKGTAVRKKTLKKTKYFECTCDRCKDPTELGTHLSSLFCPKCKKGAVGQLIEWVTPPTFTWGCSRCTYKLENKDVENLLTKFTAKALTLKDIKAQEEFLAECKEIFHLNHYIPLGVKFCLAQAYGRDEGYTLMELTKEQIHRKLELCQEVIKVLDVLTPGYSITRGHILYEIQAAEVLIARQMVESAKTSKLLIRKRLNGTVATLQEAITIFELSYPTRMLAESAKTQTLQELQNWIASLKPSF